jgi:hypothetical protein
VDSTLNQLNETENILIGGFKIHEPEEVHLDELMQDDYNRFSSHIGQYQDEEEDDDIDEEDFERGDPLSMDDLQNSPERKGGKG